LKRDASSYTRGGRWTFFAAIVAGIGLLAISYHLTGLYLVDLNEAKKPELMLVLLLVHGAFFGALSIGFLYGIFTVANAYIVQATRSRKRLYSAHMLNYAFKKFGDEIKRGGMVDMSDLVSLFSAWNANVARPSPA